MKTAHQSLQEHRAGFWRAANCDQHIATEMQLIAYNARQRGMNNASVVNADSDARYYMGLQDGDQLYA